MRCVSEEVCMQLGALPNLLDLGNHGNIWEDDRAPWKLIEKQFLKT